MNVLQRLEIEKRINHKEEIKKRIPITIALVIFAAFIIYFIWTSFAWASSYGPNDDLDNLCSYICGEDYKYESLVIFIPYYNRTELFNKGEGISYSSLLRYRLTCNGESTQKCQKILQ